MDSLRNSLKNPSILLQGIRNVLLHTEEAVRTVDQTYELFFGDQMSEMRCAVSSCKDEDVTELARRRLAMVVERALYVINRARQHGTYAWAVPKMFVVIRRCWSLQTPSKAIVLFIAAIMHFSADCIM